MIKRFLPAILTFFVTAPTAFSETVFKDTPGRHMDIVRDGKVVARYMYAHDTSTKERHHETYKPYLHVFDAEGKAPITKGAGGQFTHHRGLFVGWNKIGFNGKTYDRWHMKGGDIVHQKFLKKVEEEGSAMLQAEIHWNDENEEPFMVEKRTFVLLPVGPKKDGHCFLVTSSEFTATRGDVSLKGDPEHAGVQFRPANEVEKKKTSYLFPEGVTDVKKAKDIAWAGQNITLDGKQYGVVHLNHAMNPKGTVYSAYRDYGRFGAFFETEIAKGEKLSIAYGIVVTKGGLQEAAEIEALSEVFQKLIVKE